MAFRLYLLRRISQRAESTRISLNVMVVAGLSMGRTEGYESITLSL
jgi:hypothetical protein